MLNNWKKIQFLNRIKKSYLVILGISALIYFGNVMSVTLNTDYNALSNLNVDIKEFAGSASCENCHKEIYKSHLKTAHYLDSRPADKKFIKGSFAKGKNKFIYNQWTEVLLEQEKDSFYQTAFINGTPFQSQPFDLVIGSGRKGQSYLYWNGNKLFQLPVSYFTNADSWCNSPGFPMNLPKFDRIIPGECLECHATYANVEQDENGQSVFDKTQLIYGIDCERCHGPAGKHVEFHKENPQEKIARYIAGMKQLTRQQRLDGCALCHSGFRDEIKPRFTFTIGDTLNHFSAARYSDDSVSTLDVHGNQYGLLMASKCFQFSQMDCSSCHDVHANEVNSPKIFSQRCITCHAETKHETLSLNKNKLQTFSNNCIDCHMPMLPSRNIVLNIADAVNTVPDEVRTHRVAVYPEKTKEILMMMKKVK